MYLLTPLLVDEHLRELHRQAERAHLAVRTRGGAPAAARTGGAMRAALRLGRRGMAPAVQCCTHP